MAKLTAPVREVAGRAAIQPLPIEQAPALIDAILRENGESTARPGYRFDPDRLPADQRQRLFLVLLFALARSLFRHPPRVAAAPGGIVPPERLQ
jgi:hypothetical protein